MHIKNIKNTQLIVPWTFVALLKCVNPFTTKHIPIKEGYCIIFYPYHKEYRYKFLVVHPWSKLNILIYTFVLNI